MAGNKLGKRIAAAALALTLTLSVPAMTPAPASAASISQLQQQQAELKKQQTENAAKLKSLKADKANKVAYKNALDAQVSTVQNQIDVLNKQISALDQDIIEKESQIAAKQATIDDNIQKLKGRLHAMYLTGEASNLEIILSAKNVVDLADKTQAIEAITTHDTNLINSLKTDLQSIQTQKQQIQANRAEVAQAKVQMDQKRTELASLESEAQQVIAQINQNVSDTQAESKKLAEADAKIDAAIDEWYKQYYEELRRRQQQNNGGGSNNGGGGSGGYVSKGNFTWPVPGVNTITSGFGSRWGTFHKGIDISDAGVYGKPIVAADSGTVIMAGYGFSGSGYGGYGNVVAIDHGGGYSTLYAHMSSVAVSSGQQVTRGQVIGYVGSTGDSTGAHCHFEIRVDGVAKNPMNWFS